MANQTSIVKIKGNKNALKHFRIRKRVEKEKRRNRKFKFMNFLQSLTDPTNASKSLTGMLKNLEARLDAVLEMPISTAETVQTSDTPQSNVHTLPVNDVSSVSTPDVLTPEDFQQNTSSEGDEENVKSEDIQLKSEEVEAFKDESREVLVMELKKANVLIQELRREGEELARKDGKGREVIKKLKSKELENARLVKELNRKISDKDLEIVELRNTRDKLLDLEKKQTESIRGLNDYNQEVSKKLKTCQGEIVEMEKELMVLRQEKSLGNSNQEYEKLILEFQEFKKSSEVRELELKQELYKVRDTLAIKEKENGCKEGMYDNF